MYNSNSWKNIAHNILSNVWCMHKIFALLHFLDRICNITYKAHNKDTKWSIYIQYFICEVV